MDRLRSLIPKALDALADVLDKRDDPGRLKAALEILRLVPLPEEACADRLHRRRENRCPAGRARIATKLAEREKGISHTDRLMESMRSVSREEAEAEERKARKEVLAELEARPGGAVEVDGATNGEPNA